MHDEGLIFAMSIDGKGGGRELRWEEVEQFSTDEGLLWLHFDFLGSSTQHWIEEHSKLDHELILGITAEETRPRMAANGDALLVILRGVNLNPGAEPEDMISVRAVLDGRRIITVRHRSVRSIEDLRQALLGGDGPGSCGEFLSSLAKRLTARMSVAVATECDAIDDLDDQVAAAPSRSIRPKISESRRAVIALRRYILPQREVLNQLTIEKKSWLDDRSQARLRETANEVTRLAEDLDSARDRAGVLQDELETRVSEEMNKTMYVLSVIAAIFLPLGLLTGLLGVNVKGIPGEDNPWGFAVVCAALILIAVLQYWLFKRMHWV